jgi:hypothetical protein
VAFDGGLQYQDAEDSPFVGGSPETRRQAESLDGWEAPEAIERELAAAGARSGSPDPHPASPFLASLEEQPELERLDEPGTRTAEMAVATLVDAEEDMAEVDGFVDQLGDRAGLGLVEEDEELLVGVGEQLLVEGEEEGQATGPPQGVSPLAVQAAKQWDAQDRPKAWQGRVYGLVVHTTGGGLPAKARDKGVYPTVLAIEHYNQTHGCHYVNGWRGVEGGDLLQVANEREQAAGVAVTNPKNPHIDQRRSIERSRFEADLPADLVTRWRARWPGYKHSLELLPGTRTANSCYVHVECVPCVFAYDGKLVSAAEPLRPGLRFTRAQHDTVALLACDVARRNGWPRDQRWWRSPRLLGHEDLTPISRHTSTGGWDPGYLRKDPYFDWDYVYQAIERLQRGAGAGPAGSAGERAPAVPADQLRSDHRSDGPRSGENVDEAVPGDLEAALPDLVAHVGELAPGDGAQKESHQIAATTAPSSRLPQVQRAPQTPAQQANDMQERAGLLRAIQLLAFGFGMKNIVPDQDVEMGVDTLGKPIRAHLVHGQTDEVAMVVAGVHGSEQSGVEVAERLLQQLRTKRPFLTVVVVPRLFPDNVARRAAWDAKIAKDHGKIELGKYQELRNKAGDPGRLTPGRKSKDPNRQFPERGKDLDLANPIDAKGERVEPGNLALMALIKAFAPKRIVSIHAQKDLAMAGVFADPHPDDPWHKFWSWRLFGPGPLATEADQLAIATARRAKVLGVRVDGNTGGKASGTDFRSLYPGQDPKLSEKQMKIENARGRTLGQWGPSKGIAVFTVECPEQYRSNSAVDDPKRGVALEALASAIREILLGPPDTGANTAPASGSTAPAMSGAGSGSSAPVQRLDGDSDLVLGQWS